MAICNRQPVWLRQRALWGACFSTVGLFSIFSASAQAGLYADFQLGWSWNRPETLTIQRDQGDDLTFTTGWRTEAFELPVYYTARGGYALAWGGIELEMIHNKLIATDLPEAVDHFEISHGYNLVLLNVARPTSWGAWRLGGGTVIAHPDITLDGERTHEQDGLWPDLLGPGYQASSLAVQLATEKDWQWQQHRLLVEAKLLHASSWVSLNNGSVRVPNTSVHFTFGYGYDVGQRW